MKIFLDIDGVMVPAMSWRRPEFLSDGFPAFSKKASDALRNILQATGAEVVFTTSHKSLYSLPEWQSIFSLRGIELNKVSRLPENDTNQSRKEELLQWFSQHPLAGNFVIIDDDKSLNTLPPELKKHVVLTGSSVGLVEESEAEILTLLHQQKPVHA
ncbi:MAG: HAD domain-containing protein [Flavobacteriales bacterium]